MERAAELDNICLCFSSLPDPRGRQGVRHPLLSVLVIALLAMVCGADNAEDIQEFAESNEQWLRTFLELPYGVPSQDTYLRVFAALEPEALRQFFQQWVETLERASEGGQVAIDGKTLRRSFDRASGAKAIHMVSAWLSGAGLVLGQVKTEEKSNEITAIPELLRLLELPGTTVTIDAMGCQRAIAKQIAEGEGHYVLAVKDNQPTLHQDIAQFFADARQPERPLDQGPAPEVEHVSDVDAGHGRIEERRCWLSRDLSWVQDAQKWDGLDGIAMVEATRTDEISGATSTETRYYIVSHPRLTAADLNAVVRNHWGIENSLHWVLDMTFDEDSSRLRKGNAAESFAVMRHVAVNLLRAAPGKRRSIRGRRKRCGWDRSYLLAVLGATPSA